ncbi:tRNA(Ile)-lysidine synthetase [hydrothermal vent metagenome]|uniref:tRNA(Ile)-lysidine synthetase n=1 Tax=hydrothermal vent metagenome TaxID=652676 RepID=A0A3B1CT05_9ZZZZ
MDRLQARIYSTTKKYGMTLPGQKVCVAISGGPDSMALLAILKKLEARLEIEIKACHFDHAYRADSGEDSQVARRMAEKLGVKIITERNRDGKPASGLQLAARRLRYGFFEKLMEEGFADLVATGHTMDDSVETSIMWMIRGAGPHAFGGIPPVRGRYIRPLIESRKSAIIAWLAAEGIEYKTDPSNLTHDYLRNRVRHLVIPAMEEQAPRAVEAINRLGRLAQGQSQALDNIVAERMGRFTLDERGAGVALDFGAIAREPEAIRMSVYRSAMRKIGYDLGRLGLAHLDSVDRLVTLGNLGKVASLPGGYEARVDHGGLTFRKRVAPPAIIPIPFTSIMKEKIGDGRLTVAPAGFEVNQGEMVDMDKAPAGAVFRARRPGDYLRLKNMEGRKSFKKFLIDRKTPSGLRDRIVALASGDEILWAYGLFLSPSIAADSKTVSPVSIRFEPDGSDRKPERG